ncbi:MAG: ribokinase [Firmicutes bacterium]|nr:ribokinase [Bacillota bacterium]
MTRILNIGSLNLDHVYAVPHFLRAGETLASLSLRDFPGGKGLNQSVALARVTGQLTVNSEQLTVEVAHAGKVGEGADGAALAAVLREEGADTHLIEVVDGPSGHTIIQVTPDGQNCILLFPGSNRCLDEAFIDRVLGGYGAGDILLLQNETTCVSYAMERAAKKGLRVAFNPSPMDGAVPGYALESVRWFLLNEIEGQALTGETEPEAILAEMSRRFPDAATVLTLGKAGVLYRAGAERLAHGVYRVKVLDSTAAGDTFTGFFIGSIAMGKPPAEALRLASVAASIAVSRPGAAESVPTMAEVLESKLELE